jgi:hypothetical protein
MTEIDDNSEKYINEYMCSDYCPCLPEAENIYWREGIKNRNFRGKFTSFYSCYRYL